MLDDAEIDVPMIVPTEGDTESETIQLLFLVQTCRLWRIFRNIKRFIFNAVEVQDMVPGSLPKSYEQQLMQWQTQLPAALRLIFYIKTNAPQPIQTPRAGFFFTHVYICPRNFFFFFFFGHQSRYLNS